MGAGVWGFASACPVSAALRGPEVGAGHGKATWNAPGWSPGSPQERCWPSGGAQAACSGRLAEIRPWTWSVTVSVSSSSSRGGSWKESSVRQRHCAGSEGVLGVFLENSATSPFYTH